MYIEEGVGNAHTGHILIQDVIFFDGVIDQSFATLVHHKHFPLYSVILAPRRASLLDLKERLLLCLPHDELCPE